MFILDGKCEIKKKFTRKTAGSIVKGYAHIYMQACKSSNASRVLNFPAQRTEQCGEAAAWLAVGRCL